jgi:hypothetical protein
MILYDDKHNFLGMSSHTLSFLGYEDINDFLSMHNDFANLFVNQEGYIYNFNNFNWIDFVLYSGSANKSALIKLKNGKETKVDISIKEVYLAHDIENMKKIYSVKVFNDNFNEISNTPKTETGGLSGFSLSELVTKEPETEMVKEENIVTTTTESETATMQSPKNESFILNIADDELTSKEIVDSSLAIEDEKPQNNDFKLDFFKNEESPIEEKESISKDDFLVQNEVTSEDEKPFEFNLLKDEHVEEENIIETPSLSLQSDENTFIKDTELTSAKEEVLEDKSIKLDVVPQTITDNNFKLDFLKTDLIKEEIPEEKMSIKEESTKSANNQEIIQQIKDDIKEIDSNNSENEAPIQFDLNQPSPISFEQPQTSQVEQPIEFETNINITQEEFSNFQMKESQTSDTDDNSFTDILKGLFAGGTMAVASSAIDSNLTKEENNFAFDLKENKEEEVEEKVQVEEKIQVQEEVQVQREEIKREEPQEVSLSLSSLGLSPDDEFNLLSDFIVDTRDSIETIEQFTHTKDFDKINYALVKIKSSAEILNLNDIIDNAISMRKHCITEDSEKVTAETQRLKDNISMLEKHLEVTAI